MSMLSELFDALTVMLALVLCLEPVQKLAEWNDFVVLMSLAKASLAESPRGTTAFA